MAKPATLSSRQEVTALFPGSTKAAIVISASLVCCPLCAGYRAFYLNLGAADVCKTLACYSWGLTLG